jgi:PAS domain S-box-containing protein
LRGRDGEYRWFLSRAIPIRDEKGKVLRWFGTNTDITERRQAEREQAYLAALVQSSGDAIIGTNRDGIIESWNKGARRIFGYEAGEALGKSLSTLVPVEERREWVQNFARVLGGEIIRSETVRVCKDGRLIHVAVTGSPVILEGKVAGVCSSAADITERKQAEEELRRTREQLQQHARELEERVAERTASLQQSVKSLEELLYTIAHDLRAPNRTIEGFSQILLAEHGDKLDETGRDLLRRMVESALRNDALIRDVLNLGRVSHTFVPIGRVDVEAVVARVAHEVRGAFEEHGAELVLGESWPRVLGNEVLLGQIIGNLVSNALKFRAKDRKLRVEITSVVEGRSGVLRVKDNGRGIATEHHEKIFEPFVRLAGPEEPGTGIGLAIARKAAMRIKGTVEVESEPGRGSCFCVKLPLAEE